MLGALTGQLGIVAMLVTLVAGLMRGFAGFGSAMFMAPLFAVIFGSAEMVVTVVAMELGVSLQLFPAARRACQWRIVGPMSLAACLFMPLGLWLLLGIERAIITKAVSMIVLAFVAVLASGWTFRGEKGPVGAAVVGALSGTMMATTSVGGPPVLLYLLAGRDSHATGRANIIVYYLLTHIVLIALFVATGTVGAPALLRAVLLFPFMVLGAWLGGRMFHLADAAVFRRVALAILAAAGLFGLLR